MPCPLYFSKMPTISEDDIKRLFQIKLNVLKRCIKEHASYEAEIADQEVRIQKLLTKSNPDEDHEHVVSKQKQVLAESLRMIPDCRSRIEQAKAVLGDYLKQHSAKLSQQEKDEALSLCNK
jgi:hypothetical protein